MNNKIKLKSQNNENICPIENKRTKLSSPCSLKNTKIEKEELVPKTDKELLEQMGLAMLESDETSSSSAASAIPSTTAFVQESSENEITPSLSVGIRYHPTQDFNDNNQFNQTLGSECNDSYNADDSINNKYNVMKNVSNNFAEYYGDKKFLELKQANFLNSKQQQQITKGRSPLADSYNADDSINNKYYVMKNASNNFAEYYGDKKFLELKQANFLDSKQQQQITKGRSPLAAVACNNNLNMHQRPSSSNVNLSIQMQTPSCSSTPMTQNTHVHSSSLFMEQQQIVALRLRQQQLQQHFQQQQQQQQHQQQQQMLILDENFFLYRNYGKEYEFKENPFKKLSDEIILQIFKWLPKKTLVRCSFVCRKFNQLAQDESLWARLDLGGKTLRSGSLGDILSRGVIVLRLAQSEISDPVIDPERLQLCPEYRTKLQYLDLSMAFISKNSLSTLISKCNSLKKLSLEHVPLNDKILDEISKNVNLESLNLAMCEGIEQWSLKKMIKSLENLHSLNISWTFLNVEAISSLVQNLTPNLLRLNLAGCKKNIFDSHITSLTKKCPSLLELDLSDCTGLTSNAVPIICKFKDINYLSLSRCYGISASSYVELKKLNSLSYLDVFGILSDPSLQLLQNTFPNLSINKFIHSCVARPTVGTRRTSIWGLRTRD